MYHQQDKAPFPSALLRKTKQPLKDDIFGAFQRCEVKLPLIDLLKNIPKCPKLVKELCNKAKPNVNKDASKTRSSEHVSVIYQHKYPKTCTDPGMLTIPCSLDPNSLEPEYTYSAMLDLGASINVIPTSLYDSSTL